MSLHFYKKRIKRALLFWGSLFFSLYIFWRINESTMPYLKSIATYQVRSYVNTLLRECITEEFDGITRQEGAYNVVAIRKQLSVLLEEASNLLEQDSESAILYELPLGALTQNVLLMDVGPKIPVRMRMLQAVDGEITSELVEYGFNNALLVIQVVIRVQVEVLAPYRLEEIYIESEIPLVIDVIEGAVPSILSKW